MSNPVPISVLTTREVEQLCSVCDRWRQQKDVLYYTPQLIWTERNAHDRSPVYYIAEKGRTDVLEVILNIIRQQPQEQQSQLRYEVFERKDSFGWVPMHAAACSGDLDTVKFLLRHCPKGILNFDAKSSSGWTPAHSAAISGHVSVVEFIVQYARRGTAMLYDKDYVHATVLRLNRAVEKHFTPTKISQIAFERERNLIFWHSRSFEPDSLVHLMLGIIGQNTEVLMFRLS